MKFLFLYALLFFTACRVNNEGGGEIVARVGNETLTKENLLFLAGGQASDADVFSRTINKWVENKLLYRAALSIGLNKDIALTEKRDLFYENLLISSFIHIQTKERGITTKKEVSDYYLKNKESFKRTDDEVVVKHFAFSTKKAAKKIKKELKKKKTRVDMQDLLDKQQVETKTIRKRDAGSNHLAFVFDGVVGSVLGPKEHNKTFHLFQIIQTHKKDSFLGLERVYDEIYQRIYKEKEILILDSIVDSLYLDTDVFVSQESIKQ